MLSGVTIRAQISSVIDALSKAAVAEITKIVEDGMVVLRMEICQRENEIIKLKSSNEILNNELKAANGGQDRGSVPTEHQGREDANSGNNASNGNPLGREFPDKVQNRESTGEIQVKCEPVELDEEEKNSKPGDAPVQPGGELSRFERDGRTWGPGSMRNVARLGGVPDFIESEESQLPGPSDPSGGPALGTSQGGSSGTIQHGLAAREQHSYSYNRYYNSAVRWRSMKSLMFKRGFACPYCGKCFNRRAHLERHKLIHTGEKPYLCDVCGRRFNQKSSVKEHLKTHQKSLQTKPVEMQGTVTVEQQKASEEKPCTDTTPLENGSQSAAKEGSPKDDTRPPPAVQVKSGPEGTTAAAPPNLSYPNGGQPTREALGNHGGDLRVFERLSELWMAEPYGKKDPGSSNSGLGKAIASVPGHGRMQPPPQPTQSSFPFSGKPYVGHRDNATARPRYSTFNARGEGPISMGFNGMPWHSMEPLWARRSPSFQELKPKKCFVCTFCSKVFERSGHLERHVRIHTGEKPYGCHICGRCFNQKGSMKLHLKTHRSEQSIEMLETHQPEDKLHNVHLPGLPGLSSTAPATFGGQLPDAAYGERGGERVVTVKAEPARDDVQPPKPSGSRHGATAEQNLPWSSIMEESARNLPSLPPGGSAHADSAVSQIVRDWLGGGGGPTGEPGDYGPLNKDMSLERSKEDMETMLQEQYSVMATPPVSLDGAGGSESKGQPAMEQAIVDYCNRAAGSREDGVLTFEVPDLGSLEAGCSADAIKQSCFICLACGTSFDCWSSFERHQCKVAS